MKYLIMGRSGCGKATLANELKKQGLVVLKTYTTRQPRNKTDNQHYYVTHHEADNISGHFAEIKIHEDRYFITDELFKETDPDVIVVEPTGALDIVNRFPDINFQLVCLRVRNSDERRQHAIQRADDTIREEQIYDVKASIEDELFTDFEENIKKGINGTPFAPNAMTTHSIVNDYQIETLHAFATQLTRTQILFKNASTLVKQCILLGILDSEKENTVNTYSKNQLTGEISSNTVSCDHFVESIMANPEDFNLLMTEWLSCPLRLDNTLSPIFNDNDNTGQPPTTS